MKMMVGWMVVVREYATEGKDLGWIEQHLAELEFGDRSSVGELVGAGAVERWAREGASCDPAVFDRLSLTVGDVSAAELMAIINGPIHVAYGDVETGGTVEPEELGLLRTHARRPSSTHFPGQSHMIHLTDPQGIVADLDGWLTANEL